jgi:hypothetical protein
MGFNLIVAIVPDDFIKEGWVWLDDSWYELMPEDKLVIDEICETTYIGQERRPSGLVAKVWQADKKEALVRKLCSRARRHDWRRVLVSHDATEILSWLWEKACPGNREEFGGSLWQIATIYHKLRMAERSDCRTFHLERFHAAIEELPKVFYVA